MIYSIMYLQKLSLTNFKNYKEAELNFSEKINCLTGDNGAGKTNLLDAIHYLSFCKSYFNPLDSQNILHDASFFAIQGAFLKNGKKEKIHCGLKRKQRKIIKRNKKEYDRLSDHIGLLPLVMISPEDSSLITEGSEYRRKFIDIIVSQLDKTYLNNLISYNKIVLQRNSLLRRFAESGTFDKVLLEAMDVQMIGLGVYIHEKRLSFIEEFLTIFEKHYEFITDGKEKVSIEYQSQLNDMDFKKILNDAIDKDKRFQYSTVGVHKDELVFKIASSPPTPPKRGERTSAQELPLYQIKKFGSQGQQKSFLIALKLAQFDFIKSIKKFKPILLLDDIFDKLDALRVQKLMELVSDNNFGQIFITHTHPQRLSKILSDINAEYKVYEIEQGVICH